MLRCQTTDRTFSGNKICINTRDAEVKIRIYGSRIKCSKIDPDMTDQLLRTLSHWSCNHEYKNIKLFTMCIFFLKSNLSSRCTASSLIDCVEWSRTWSSRGCLGCTVWPFWSGRCGSSSTPPISFVVSPCGCTTRESTTHTYKRTWAGCWIATQPEQDPILTRKSSRLLVSYTTWVGFHVW